MLVRSVDAGPTYVSMRWLDEAVTSEYSVVSASDLEPFLENVRAGLMAPLSSDAGGHAPLRRVLETGLFANPDRIRAVAAAVSELILPPSFWARLHAEQGYRQVRVRVIPSRRLAAFPWELLSSPSGNRLLELATVVYEVPATIHYRRPVSPSPFDPAGAPLFTIDPIVPDPFREQHLEPTLDWRERGGPRLTRELGVSQVQMRVSRHDLSRQLRSSPRPNRWLYLGHVSNARERPDSASLHLTDDAKMSGRAELMGLHRPFTALDMFLGPTDVGDSDDAAFAYAGRPGTDVWPMPNRVALIACQSGSEHAASEPFGLIVSAMFAGAEYVTSTRWTMPTDFAFNVIGRSDLFPTTDLVLAVNRAHQEPDPIATLRDWQLSELQVWDTTGDIGHSPLLFTGITTHHAPPRDPVTGIPVNRVGLPIT